MNPACFIFGYGGGQNVLDINMPLFEWLGLPIYVCCPANDLLQSKYPIIANGESSYIGPKSVERMRLHLKSILKTGHDFALVCEADSFPLTKEINWTNGLQGIVHYNLEYIRFMALRFALPPWIIDRESIERLVEVTERYPDIQEEGYDDRLLAAWAMHANIPILGYKPRGFAKDLLTPSDFGEIYQAYSEGVRFFHGIKTLEVRDYLCRIAGISI